MITKEKIDRINQLAKKSKTAEGLTPEEKKEQECLRREYIDSFKANLKSQLDRIQIVEEEEKVAEEVVEELEAKINLSKS